MSPEEIIWWLYIPVTTESEFIAPVNLDKGRACYPEKAAGSDADKQLAAS